MISFEDLEAVAPEIAGPIRERFEQTGLAIIGTLRGDGSPRVSPIEVSIQHGRLYLGMMPGSQKAHDVARDPRCALLTTVADKHDVSGEGKLFGEVRALSDAVEIGEVLHGALQGTGVDPATLAGSPVFEVLVTGAAWQHVDGETWVTLSWTPGGGVRRRHRDGPTGIPVDVP